MPVMQNMLLFAQEKQLDSLWGTTLVCCAMIGEASGVEVFRNDAEAIMNLLVTLQNRTDAASDVNRYLLQAWVYIARCLEHEFAPYLGPVMIRILQTIEHNAKECEQELSEENFEELLIDIEDNSWKELNKYDSNIPPYYDLNKYYPEIQ